MGVGANPIENEIQKHQLLLLHRPLYDMTAIKMDRGNPRRNNIQHYQIGLFL